MEDLIKTLGLGRDTQVFVPINKKENIYLSVVLEDHFIGTDKNGYLYSSRTPLGQKLNCAVQTNEGNAEYLEFFTEDAFYKFMSKNIYQCI